MDKLPNWLRNKWVLFALSALGTLLLLALFYLLFLRASFSGIFLDQALAYYEDENYDAAIEKFETALDMDPENLDIYLGYTDALTAAGQYDRAIEIINQGMERIRGEEKLYLRKAKVFVQAGRLGAAVDFLDGIDDGLLNKTIQKRRPANLSYTPSPGKYNSVQKVTLVPQGNETIYYTLTHGTEGEDPTLSSNTYTAPITISSDTVLTAIAVDENGLVSPRLTLFFEIDNPNEPIEFSDPTIELMVRNALDSHSGKLRAAQLASVQVLSTEEGMVIRSLDDLEYLPALNSLYLHNQVLIQDYSVLGRLPALTTLAITDSGLNDTTLPQLASCTRLRELYLQNNTITSLDGIRDLQYLEYLDLGGNRIQNLANIQFPALIYLNLSQNGTVDLNGLENLKALRTLDISSDRISDLAPIASLTALEDLWMSGNTPSNIKKLRTLKNLTSLDVSDCGLTSLSVVNDFPALTTLIAENNEISSLSTFTKKVNDLYLTNNPLSDLSPLQGQTSLVALHLGGTQVSDLSPLRSLAKLEFLDLCETPVSDLSPLKQCPALATLFCSDGTDVTGLPDTIDVNFD